MASTTVRVSEPSHVLLRALAERCQKSMQQVIAEALEAYHKQLFWTQANHEFEHIRNDPEAWQEEQEEQRLWDQTVGDGLDEEDWS